MQKLLIIADVTKAFPNTIPSVREQVLKVCAMLMVDPQDLAVVALNEQAVYRDSFPVQCSWQIAQTVYDAPGSVSQILHRRGSEFNRVLILSFNPAVWALKGHDWGRLSVEAEHMFRRHATFSDQPLRLAPGGASFQTLSAEGPEPPWNFEHICSLDEALDTLVKALFQRSAVNRSRAIRQTALRPAMNLANSAKFYGSSASTRSSGMIGVLLRIACVRGLVEAGGEEPSDLFVWLKQPDVTTRREEPVAPAEQRIEACLVHDQGDSPAPLAAGEVSRGTGRQRQPEKYLSDRFSTVIAEQKMGPFPTARPVVHEALQASVRKGLRLCELVDSAIAVAQTKLPSPQPWPAIRQVTIRQILRAGVALDAGGEALPNSWAGAHAVVTNFSMDWEKKVEGEILLALFGAQEVSGEDLRNIARSVWGSGNSEAEGKAHGVIQYLIEAGRLEEDGSGVFRVRRFQQGLPTALGSSGDADGPTSPLLQ